MWRGLFVLLVGCGGPALVPLTEPVAVPSVPDVTFSAAVAQAFADRDLNQDGELSLGEIEQALADPELKDAPAAALAVLRLRGASVLPLSLADLPSRAEPFQPAFAKALQRIRAANRELFVGEVPTLENLSQGQVGDCFVLAPLGAMLHREARDIVACFRPEPGGKMWVHFGAGRAVYIDALTDGELIMLATNDNAGLWVQTFEKAVGAFRAKHRTFEPQVAAYRAADQIPGQPLTPLTVLAHGGNTATTLELLTGHAIEGFGLSWGKDTRLDANTREHLVRRLQMAMASAQRERRLVVYSSPDSLRVPGMSPHHAYAVLSYDAERQEVTLWNPHGVTFVPKGKPGLVNGYATTNGRFRVPILEVVQFSGGFAFETERPVTK